MCGHAVRTQSTITTHLDPLWRDSALCINPLNASTTQSSFIHFPLTLPSLFPPLLSSLNHRIPYDQPDYPDPLSPYSVPLPLPDQIKMFSRRCLPQHLVISCTILSDEGYTPLGTGSKTLKYDFNMLAGEDLLNRLAYIGWSCGTRLNRVE